MAVNLSNYTLAFADEFNTRDIQSAANPDGTWKTVYHFGGRTLLNNGEAQLYVDPDYKGLGIDPFTVANGIMTISAKPSGALQSQLEGQAYTSGLLTTQESFFQTYGYFEMKAQLPVGKGLWPAFWLQPTDLTWPPEIDVMEVVGDMTKLYTTRHTSDPTMGRTVGTTTTVSNMSVGFHTFGVDWTPTDLVFYFDGNEVWRTKTPSDFHKPMYMLANLAVGGSWPGYPDSTNKWPAEFKIDYIRAYENAYTIEALPVDPTPALRTGDSFNRVEGTNYANRLYGTAGADLFIGRGGSDRFMITRGQGNDVIADFGSSDQIIVSGSHASATAAKPYIVQRGTDTVVYLGSGQTLTLRNVDVTKLAPSQIQWTNPQPVTDAPPAPGTPAPAPTPTPTPTPSPTGWVEPTGTPASTTTINGTAATETIYGTRGAVVNDRLVGNGGADTLIGGQGNDTYVVTNAGEIVVESVGEGIDLVESTATLYTLTANVENLWVRGAGATGIGNDLANRITLANGGTANGKGGNDLLTGGAGTDVFIVAKGEGSDHIRNFAANDKLVLAGSSFADFTALKAAMTQSGSHTVIALGDGQTVTLEGVASTSLVAAQFQFDTAPVPTPTPTPTPTPEPTPVPASPAVFTLPESGAATRSVSGTGGNDVLTGTTANEKFWGGNGTDRFSGLAGDDAYVVGTQGATVVETAGQGIDTVLSWAKAYTLTANVENLTVLSSGASGIGNELDNILRGSAGTQTLSGGAGRDILIGEAGADVLTGGAGTDIFKIASLDHAGDRITDFKPGEDLIDLRGLFQGAGYTGANPVADGWLKMVASGTGTAVFGGPGAATQIVMVDHVAPANLTVQADILWA